MRINYTMMGTGKTGGAIVLNNIINKLVERGHQVTVTLARKPKNSIAWLSPEVKIITPQRLGTRLSYLGFVGLNELIRRITKEDLYLNVYHPLDILEKITPECDINVATFCLTAFPVYRSGKGVPFYHMQHFEELLFSDRHHKALARESYTLPLNRIANSLWLRDKLRDEFGEAEADIPVVNPAINLDIFQPRKSAEPKGLKKRVVCYGSNTVWKGFREAVAAMKMVFRERQDTEWIVFGLSPLREYDNEAPYSFRQAVFNEKLAELYSTADVVFCPSWYESFPLPPLEAMACGAPVVTTRLGTEDYCRHGENSLVVPPREPKLLAEAILNLLEDRNLADRLRQNGMETAKQFTWDKTADKVEALFKSKV